MPNVYYIPANIMCEKCGTSLLFDNNNHDYMINNNGYMKARCVNDRCKEHDKKLEFKIQTIKAKYC